MGHGCSYRPDFWEEIAPEVGMAGNDDCAFAGIFVFHYAVCSPSRDTAGCLAAFTGVDRLAIHRDPNQRALSPACHKNHSGAGT